MDAMAQFTQADIPCPRHFDISQDYLLYKINAAYEVRGIPLLCYRIIVIRSGKLSSKSEHSFFTENIPAFPTRVPLKDPHYCKLNDDLKNRLRGAVTGAECSSNATYAVGPFMNSNMYIVQRDALENIQRPAAIQVPTPNGFVHLKASDEARLCVSITFMQAACPTCAGRT